MCVSVDKKTLLNSGSHPHLNPDLRIFEEFFIIAR